MTAEKSVTMFAEKVDIYFIFDFEYVERKSTEIIVARYTLKLH